MFFLIDLRVQNVECVILQQTGLNMHIFTFSVDQLLTLSPRLWSPALPMETALKEGRGGVGCCGLGVSGSKCLEGDLDGTILLHVIFCSACCSHRLTLYGAVIVVEF